MLIAQHPGAQDVIKKGSGDELPDFYNIVLERPRDDDAGYDVLFIDAASKARNIPGATVLRRQRM